MRLWGIAEQPFWPGRNGSMTSPISVCWRLRISVAKRSRLPPRIAIAARNAAWRSRWTIWVLTGSTRRPSSASTSASISGARWLYVPDRAADLAGRDLVDGLGEPVAAAVDLERPARELEPERRRLGVDRVGAAHHHRAGLDRAPGSTSAAMSRSASRSERLAGGPQLERERRVDDVAAGQAEVEVAALGPDGLGDLRRRTR